MKKSQAKKERHKRNQDAFEYTAAALVAVGIAYLVGLEALAAVAGVTGGIMSVGGGFLLLGATIGVAIAAFTKHFNRGTVKKGLNDKEKMAAIGYMINGQQGAIDGYSLGLLGTRKNLREEKSNKQFILKHQE